MLCILCLTPPTNSISIFDLHGRSLNVGGVITKHFWLQPNEDNPNARVICKTCWEALIAFHKFYQKVEESHESLTAAACVSIVDKVEEEIHLKEDIVDDKFIDAPDDKTGEQESLNKPIFSNEGTNIEIRNVTKSEPDVIEEATADPLEEVRVKKELMQEVNSDSESEIPLSRLSDQRKSHEPRKQSQNIANNLKCLATKFEGIWSVTSYHDEIEKPMGSQDLGQIINQNIDLSCTVCQKTFEDFFVFRDHFQKAHNEPGYVACCDKKFTVRRNLVDHILLHKYPNYFKCDKCPKVLASRKNLKEHMRIHDRKFIFPCGKCSKVFDRKLMLQRHMDIHVAERTFKCEQCDKLFASKFSLGQHIYGIHKGGYTKVCDQCGKVTRDKEAFVRHQLEHTGAPKPYVTCEQCGAKLANKNGLRKHTQEKHPNSGTMHVCNVCGSTATSTIALRRHITFMHKYERSHKCPMCDKAFKRALTLKHSRANEVDQKHTLRIQKKVVDKFFLDVIGSFGEVCFDWCLFSSHKTMLEINFVQCCADK